MPILKIKDENGKWISIPALKGDKYDDTEIRNELGTKANIPQISEEYANATEITLQDNTIHRFMNMMNALSITLPDEFSDLFQCEVVFKSGTTATSLTYDESIKWSGDDIKDNVFVPELNKTYNILFWYDGFNMNAVVRGV